MEKKTSDLRFRAMAAAFAVRDLLLPRIKILGEVGIRQEDHVLDYGCGPGSYTFVAAALVGESGKVYALDVHPLAVRMVKAGAEKRGLANVEAILSDCATGLPGESVDAVLLYDTLHLLDEPGRVLEEIRRVLKPGGVLSCRDHHLGEEDMRARLAASGFGLAGRGRRTYGFHKVSPA